MSRAPAHAGRLRPSEQFVFALVFALMAGFVVVITMSAARSPQNLLFGGGSTAAGTPTFDAGTGGVFQQVAGTASGSTPIRPASRHLNALLAAALGTVLSAHPGRLAVGVIDETTGQQALYHASQQFSSAGIVTADILAALLVRHERAARLVTGEQAAEAAAMMDKGSAAAAMSLWRAVGGGNGLASANRLLKLSHTAPGAGAESDLTRTTAADQLQLLLDLTSVRYSPLTKPGRDYVLGLMTGDAAQEHWGVSAVTAEGAVTAVRDGWLPDGQLWVANSIGVVLHAGHLLLVAVLSSRSSSQAAGISLASAAAVAAADVMTRTGH
jgi:hypothetical protein